MAQRTGTPRLGGYIVRVRTQRGWTRAELARQAGLSYTTLRYLEKATGVVRTSEDNLKAIADALGTTQEERDRHYELMLVLAGYKTVPSKNGDDRQRRISKLLESYKNLERVIERILDRGDPDEIDQLAATLEINEQLRKRKN
jgi:transcriptional regulator with XRE-family HTH domain